MRKFVVKRFVQIVLRTLAWFAERPGWNAVTKRLTNGLAALTVKTKKIRSATSVEDLGVQWQRSFPARKQVPLTGVEGNTVFAEIHTPCPLRGTGDVDACWRMMNFDREVLRRAGGRFVVLESQAEPGKTVCKVAMRPVGADMSDLTPAHERTGKPVP